MLKSTKKRVVPGLRKVSLKGMPPPTAVMYRLPPIEFNQTVKDRVENILTQLNRNNPPQDLDANFTSAPALFMPPATGASSVSSCGGNYVGLLGAAIAHPIKRKTLGDHLRSLVDEWLDSGFFHGSEVPKKRNFEKSPRVQLALFSFSKSGKLLLVPYGDRPLLYLDEKHLPVVRRDEVSGLDYIEPLDLSFEEISQEEMAFILLSDLRVRLAKCRKCNTYFLLKHWNRTYSHGTKCDTCGRESRKDDSVASTASARANAYEVLYRLAAKKFRKKLEGSAGWQKDKALKTAIAEYLNPHIQRSTTLRAIHNKPITGKWTAHPNNWQGINSALKATSLVASKPKGAKKAKR
jgi:hypothetical protein